MDEQNGLTGTLRLLDALNADPPYDPRCERFETAVKAIWLLYRRSKWDLLALMGLPRADFEPIFTTFDLLIERHYLDDETATRLLTYTRQFRAQSGIRLLSAVTWMIGKYRQRKLTYYNVQVKGPQR